METKKINHSVQFVFREFVLHRQTCRQTLSIIIAIRVLLLLVTVCIFTKSNAQKIWEERKGCIRAQGNLAPGYLFSQKAATGYVNGDIDLFFHNHVSFTGSAWGSFITSRKNITGVKANHAVFGGINYHILKTGKWDPYIGFTPGVGIVQATYKEADVIKKTPYAAVPLVAASVGCNYYVGWIFHVFVKVQAVSGQVFSTLPAPIRLDELKFMAGLGWNIRAWKPKKKDNYTPVVFNRKEKK